MSLVINHTYRIVGICSADAERFHNIGLTISTLIKIKHIHGSNGPIVIETDERLIALRRKEIACLKLQ